MSETWTIGELAQQAADALGGGSPAANGRVREVPGERLIRWYTTIGLVDPPLTRRGRVARYGRRHLLQLVAVKRLQASGLSIAEIQAALAGAPDSVLAKVADTPPPEAPLTDAPPAEPPPGATRAAPRFWTARPTTTPSAAPATPTPLHGIKLTPHVTLLLEGATRTPTPHDIEAVLAAAGPLLEVLEERSLL
ncbi:helix-turn-helix domain-containing protein [Nonomuraea soli]|uniref:DNA-binding transcriptional MerR regulator n=1 Tax=Nonomuraea soli TaxID=1032476 RepID=A0A7W0CE78_9ACTN|nr:helix-turn-helix domain-containing protein [Nonomuraea soli]MBA2889530.1 DNA-binding transcriptional MerR regulator [Nonomuraea soli]